MKRTKAAKRRQRYQKARALCDGANLFATPQTSHFCSDQAAWPRSALPSTLGTGPLRFIIHVLGLSLLFPEPRTSTLGAGRVQTTLAAVGGDLEGVRKRDMEAC